MRAWPLLVVLFLTVWACNDPSPTASPSGAPVVLQSPTPHETEQPSGEIPEHFQGVDVRDMIRLKDTKSVATRRQTLYRFLWGQNDLPTLKPKKVGLDDDSAYKTLKSASKVEKLEVSLSYQLKSFIHHLSPEKPNGVLIIYHGGHEDVLDHKEVFEKLLQRGYSVAVLDMLLCGGNNKPNIWVDGKGKFFISLHDQLFLLPVGRGSQMRWFFEPIVATVNHFEKDYKTIHMWGFSGGGWSTAVYAALDPRIQRSYEVAGSLPLFLREWHRESGDQEQWHPPFYRLVNYVELYIMASVGENRAHYQLFNQYDDVAFYGVRSRVYEKTVSELVRKMSPTSTFQVQIDQKSQKHEMNSSQVDWILKNLEQ